MYITYPYTLDIDCMYTYFSYLHYNPYVQYMVYWPTKLGHLWGKCSWIYHTWIIWVISNYITRFRIFRTIACSEQLSYTGSMNSITPRQWVRFDSGKTSWLLMSITRQQGRFCTGFLGQSCFLGGRHCEVYWTAVKQFSIYKYMFREFYSINGWFHWLYAIGVSDQCCKYGNKYAETTNPTNPCVPVSLCSMPR